MCSAIEGFWSGFYITDRYLIQRERMRFNVRRLVPDLYGGGVVTCGQHASSLTTLAHVACLFDSAVTSRRMCGDIEADILAKYR
jgi:hypothetical protein